MLLGAVTEGKTGRHSVTETHVAETDRDRNTDPVTETHVAGTEIETQGRLSGVNSR